MTTEQVRQIRTFNRFYTDLLGLLNSNLLDSRYSLAEARILFEISNGPCSSSDIIETLNIDKGYLSRILKKFENENLIQRQPSEADGRVSLLTLSVHGLNVFTELDAASSRQIEKLIAHLDQPQIDILMNGMGQIMQVLRLKT